MCEFNRIIIFVFFLLYLFLGIAPYTNANMVIDLSDYRNLSITISPLLSTKVQETIITKKANNQFHQEPSFLLSYPFFTRESSFTIKAVDGIDTDMIKISRYQTNPLFEEKKQAKVW